MLLQYFRDETLLRKHQWKWHVSSFSGQKVRCCKGERNVDNSYCGMALTLHVQYHHQVQIQNCTTSHSFSAMTFFLHVESKKEIINGIPCICNLFPSSREEWTLPFSASAAATSFCVEKMLHAAHRTLAPRALSVSISTWSTKTHHKCCTPPTARSLRVSMSTWSPKTHHK